MGRKFAYRKEVLEFMERELSKHEFTLKPIPGSFKLETIGGDEHFSIDDCGIELSEKKDGELYVNEHEDARIQLKARLYGLKKIVISAVHQKTGDGRLIYRAFEALYDREMGRTR